MLRHLAGVLVVSMWLCLTSSSAIAQTAPSLVIQPWPDEPIVAQTFDQPTFITGGHTQGDDTGIRIFFYDSVGRVKLDRQEVNPNVAVGYRVVILDVDADRMDLNGRYNDISLAGGFQLGTFGENDQWDVALIGGLGSANDGHWDDSNATYGIGVLNFSRELGPKEQIHTGISYHGNRVIFPDVPLPYFTYVNHTRTDLTYEVGLPSSRVTWQPCDQVAIALRYDLPSNITGSVTYTVSESLSVFAEYERRLSAFHEHDAMHEHQRLFYRLSTISTGVSYHHALADVRVGVGYAFNQEFSRGFDARDTDGIADLSDEVLFFFSVAGTF